MVSPCQDLSLGVKGSQEVLGNPSYIICLWKDLLYKWSYCHNPEDQAQSHKCPLSGLLQGELAQDQGSQNQGGRWEGEGFGGTIWKWRRQNSISNMSLYSVNFYTIYQTWIKKNKFSIENKTNLKCFWLYIFLKIYTNFQVFYRFSKFSNKSNWKYWCLSRLFNPKFWIAWVLIDFVRLMKKMNRKLQFDLGGLITQAYLRHL